MVTKFTDLTPIASLALTDIIMVTDDPSGTPLSRSATFTNVKTLMESNIKLDDLQAPDDNTDLDATASLHGLMPKADKSKLDGIETAADVTDATNVNAAGATMNTDTDLSSNSYLLDEDDMSSDDATKVASQQSIKAYVDSLGLAFKVVKSADNTPVNNSTTLITDTDLTVSLAASTLYFFEVDLFWTSVVAAGLRVSFTIPSGATGVYGNPSASGATTGGITAVKTGLIGHATAQNYLKLSGHILTTNAGTFALQFAQSVADASNSTTKKGSMMRVWKG